MTNLLSGKMIAAMGIPGCGKSSVIRELVELYPDSGIAYFEPEETGSVSEIGWPDAIHGRAKYGYFGSITWFRAMRVPGLYKAQDDAREGKIAFVDSYFDKLLTHYLENENMSWFLPKNDPYHSLIKQMAELDYVDLPNADIVVFFDLDEETWEDFVVMRGRMQDGEEEYRAQCFGLREPMLDACKRYSKEHDKKLLIFKQEPTGVSQAALRLKSVLENSCG